MEPTTPNDVTPESPLPKQVVLPTEQGPTVYSPSPNQGEQTPRRREVDTKTYSTQWASLGLALLTWAVSFLSEISKLSWTEIQTLSFVAGHAAQMLGVIVAVLAARQIKN